jgi:chloride channel protein, CIC family
MRRLSSTGPATSGADVLSAKRPRRALGEVVLHVPQTLRALVRTDEIWLALLAAVIGIAAGLVVVAMNTTTEMAHQILFLLPPGQQLSGAVKVDPLRSLLVPTIGGLAVGATLWALARWWPRRTIDPIEANALYGGQMSMIDSLIVVAQTMLSNGVGASVGLEAGYAQIGAAFGSRFGRAFRVRRSDLRLLVGCGAAGAISAAFNAPLTGSFYGFELIIGTYSLATLAPVVLASICAVLVMRALTGGGETLNLRLPTEVPPVDYIEVLAMGILCALAGIAIMRGVTLTESLFRRSRVPIWLRPAIGGGLLGCMALVTPAVLSSGHSALHDGFDAPYTLGFATLLFFLKAASSAVSVGSGFRGGLFFASLFLGATLGKVFAGVTALFSITAVLPPVVCSVVCMSALAVAVVGGPLTMSFLALESTGSLPMTTAVLVASVISALTVRRTFGYSFATWRFHLRGEAIRSAVDIGWMRSLTVGRMMRREVRTVRSDLSLAAFRREVPLGAHNRIIALDPADRYAGIVLVPEAHAAEETATRVSDVLHYQKSVLLPQMTVKEAIAMFEAAESDALAVVDGPTTMKVIGLLTEQYTLRRYSEELDRRRRELSGE